MMIWTQLVCHCSVSLCLVPLSLSLLTILPGFQRGRKLVSAQHLDRLPASLACGRVSGLGTLTTQHHAVGTQIDTSIWLSILICKKHKACCFPHIFTLQEKYDNKITFHYRVGWHPAIGYHIRHVHVYSPQLHSTLLIKNHFSSFLHFKYIPNQKLHFVHEENPFSYFLHFIITLWAEHGDGREEILSSRGRGKSILSSTANAASLNMPRALKHIMQIVSKYSQTTASTHELCMSKISNMLE